MRGLRLLLGLAILSWAPGALAQNGAASKVEPAPAQMPRTGPAQIDRNGVLILIRTVLLALDSANQTGNYTVLRDLGAPQFQAANNAARLSEIFASLRARNLDLSGVAVLDPQLTVLPEIGANGLMRMAGFFPSVPLQVNFELLFAPANGKWRLFGISLNVDGSAPVAPGGAPAEPPKPAEPPRQETQARPPPDAKPASETKPTPRPALRRPTPQNPTRPTPPEE